MSARAPGRALAGRVLAAGPGDAGALRRDARTAPGGRARRPPRRPATAGAPLGTIYMVCFDRPYRHARHYTGWSADLLDRLWRHAQGHGARLMRVIWEAGIGFTLVRTCEGTRATERAIKAAGGAVRYCPRCSPRPRNGRWGELPADLVPRRYPCRPSGGPRWVLAPFAAAEAGQDDARPVLAGGA